LRFKADLRALQVVSSPTPQKPSFIAILPLKREVKPGLIGEWPMGSVTHHDNSAIFAQESADSAEIMIRRTVFTQDGMTCMH